MRIPKGRKRLREAIKQFYGPQFGRDLDIEKEILVTVGATGGDFSDTLVREVANLSESLIGLYATFAAFLEQGDEVIIFEPYFDQYPFFSGFNGGKPVFVPLHPPAASIQSPTTDDWKIDFDELRSVRSPRI